jgi:hypothetical protein
VDHRIQYQGPRFNVCAICSHPCIRDPTVEHHLPRTGSFDQIHTVPHRSNGPSSVQPGPLITRSTPHAFSSPRCNQAAAFAQGHGGGHRRETANPALRCFLFNQLSATRRGGDDEHNGRLLTGVRTAELAAHGVCGSTVD